MNFRSALLVAAIFFTLFSCDSSRFTYQNHKKSFDERADDLVSRMTLEEKVGQLSHYAEAIDHLGIPEYNWWNECLHGVARAGKATVFPQAIGMAATFDRDLMYRMADITSTEARAKYNDFISREKRGMYQGLTFWSPNINIFRDPRWGRGHETYGEDPYLTGEMGVQFIRGLQGNDPRYLKVVATAKHFAVHSGPESLRHEFNAVVDQLDFRDTYLPAFKKAVKKARVYSVMCAYNRYLGEPCCGSIPLQEELLRDELGFQGYIVSDCGAIRDFHSGHHVVSGPEEAAAAGIRAGTDLNCGRQYNSLVKAVEAGLVAEMEIDVVVRRLMLARMKLGMFDPDHLVPWSELTLDTLSCDLHKRTALEMARKSIVLLKNENGALPLKKEGQKIAVIGPNANNVYAQLGNYNGSPVQPVSVFEGIKSKVSGNAEVRYSLGSPHHSGLPYLVPVPGEVLFRDQEKTRGGLRASYYSNLEGSGEPVLEKTQEQVDQYWWDGEPPEEGLTDDNYSVVWQGFLVPRHSGEHALGVDGKFFTLLLDSDTLIKHHNIHHPTKTYRKLQLEEGRPYKLKLIMADRHGDANCTLHWEEPGLPHLWEAVQTAAWADHVILVLGLTARLEGEEIKGLELDGFYHGDRNSLDLPEIQQQLIRRIEATGRPITLVLMTGSAVSIVRENERLPSILQSWYGGEAAGTAIADVLFGDYNPAGRLPVTFYNSVNDLPDFEDYSMADRTYRYFNNEVLYPFGYGLSYSEFSYDNLILEKNEISQDESLMVSVEITNLGKVAGEEVVQMYIRDVDAEVRRSLKDLCGFARVMIYPGQTIVVSMELGPGELEYYDEKLSYYRVTPGEYEILVGPSSSEDVLLRERLRVR